MIQPYIYLRKRNFIILLSMGNNYNNKVLRNYPMNLVAKQIKLKSYLDFSFKLRERNSCDMENMNLVDYLGYFASIMIAISFLMKSINKLRLVNIIGFTCFVIYSVIIRAWPVALINFFSICINGFYLSQGENK
jgi:hypothetical protein